MLLQMEVFGLSMDSANNSPIVILKSKDRQEVLPIWIGVMEATAIAAELENINFARPMTHDLLWEVIKVMGGKVEKVVVCDLRENTYYALIYLKANGKRYEIDARPSDTIALALRAKAPIFIEEEVLEKSKGTLKAKEGINDQKAKKWTEVLEKLSLKDFGKYKM
jgi:hypothetical protein